MIQSKLQEPTFNCIKVLCLPGTSSHFMLLAGCVRIRSVDTIGIVYHSCPHKKVRGAGTYWNQ